MSQLKNWRHRCRSLDSFNYLTFVMICSLFLNAHVLNDGLLFSNRTITERRNNHPRISIMGN
nr:MAG TPA: hypothetical protein [Caudoviricetes sp.]